MTSTLGPGEATREAPSRQARRRVDGRLVVLLVVVALYSRGMLSGSLDPVALRTWTTVFVAIVVQALPFLALGVLISGAITALVSPAVLARVLPRPALLAVPSAALAGTALPGCECASVPIAGRLTARGVQPAAAVAFMLAAHDRLPGLADLDRVLEPVEFAAQASVEGRAWIAGLPALLDRLCRRWRLQVEDGLAARGYHGMVVPVRRGEERWVLKLTWPAERAVDEARALAAWRGQGAVLLLEADPAAGALLLERLDPTRTLDSLELRAAAQVAGRLLRRLAIPAPERVRPLRAMAAAIAASLPGRQERLGRPVPKGWLAAAGGLAHELGARAGDRLVHADLHYGNVLAGNREPWLAIDPKPVAGDPEHAVPELLWTRVDELEDAAAIRRLLAVLAGSGELDGEKARGWAIVRCVDYWLWGLENGLTEDPKRCRRILAALA